MSAEERAAFERFKVAQAEERAAFERFRAAEAERKREEEESCRRAEEAKAAREAAIRLEAQTQAINLFKEMLAKWVNGLYSDDLEILRKGKLILLSGAGAIEYPHAFLAYWREQRYIGKVLKFINTSGEMTREQIEKNGHDCFDGWPLKDEADVEAARLLAVEWSQYTNFCRRFAERAERAA